MAEIRQISVLKGKHKYVFRYQVGDEANLLVAFAYLASNKETDFDWYDAAVLSYQVGQRVELEI